MNFIGCASVIDTPVMNSLTKDTATNPRDLITLSNDVKKEVS